MTCSELRCILLQISGKLTNKVFFVPSLSTWGGIIVYLRRSPPNSGLSCLSFVKARCKSSLYVYGRSESCHVSSSFPSKSPSP